MRTGTVNTDAPSNGASSDTASLLTTVAFQGARGAYSEDAIHLVWHDNVVPIPVETFGNVVDAVNENTAQYGVIPIENSAIGHITAASLVLSEALSSHPHLRVIDHVTVPVSHALLAPFGAQLATVTQVTSHPAALGQCRRFLESHPTFTIAPAYDTAGAARAVAARGDIHVAAIAGVRAAYIYQLQILAKEIQDMSNNHTRFAIITNERRIGW